MATLLLLNPIDGIVQTVESGNVMTFVQSGDVNLAEPTEGSASGRSQSGAMGGMGSLFPIVAIIAVMFIMMRPRKDKEGEKFRNSLQKDQEVVTSSGVFGRVREIDDVSVVLEISQNTRIRVDKRFVNPVPTVQSAKEPKKNVPNKDEKA